MSEINFEYKKMHPFKWFILENYPFLEDSIDTLTNYQLFCKLGEEINKNRDAINTLGGTTEDTINAFNTLYDYVHDFFDNLNVQTEVDNKLDEMALDGTLENIINQEIFGEIQSDISNLDTKIDTVESNLERNALYIGNSYTYGEGSTGNNKGIFYYTKDMFSHAYSKTSGGIGWLEYPNHENNTFADMLTLAINDPDIDNDSITDIIVIGAWGDTRAIAEYNAFSSYVTAIKSAIDSFNTLINNNFPNVIRRSYTLGESRGVKHIGSQYASDFSYAFWVHNKYADILPQHGFEYLGWIGFNILLQTSYFASDNFHPNDAGYKKLSALFKTAYNGGITYYPYLASFNNVACGITSGTTITGFSVIYPDHVTVTIRQITLHSGTTTAAGNNITLLDFNNVSSYTIPVPVGHVSGQDYRLGDSFMCTTEKRNESPDFSKNLMGRINLLKNSDNESASISLVSLSAAQTIATDSMQAYYTPGQITYSLRYQ